MDPRTNLLRGLLGRYQYQRILLVCRNYEHRNARWPQSRKSSTMEEKVSGCCHLTYLEPYRIMPIGQYSVRTLMTQMVTMLNNKNRVFRKIVFFFKTIRAFQSLYFEKDEINRGYGNDYIRFMVLYYMYVQISA